MNNDFPLLSLTRPEIVTRRRDRPSQVPLPPEILARRQEIARRLSEKITPLSNSIREMSDEERKAIFLKIEHERAVQLPGLKRVAEPTERFTLAVPLTDNLDQLVAQVQEFGAGELKRGHAPHSLLNLVGTISLGKVDQFA